jgi:hypothetical protein
MANKTASIKSATDKELDELLIRLRKENEVQDLVGSLKRKSTPTNQYSYEPPAPISTDEPIESLYHNEDVDHVLAHFGVLGMKWGVQRGSKTESSTSKQRKKDSKSVAKDDKEWAKSKSIRKLASDSLVKTTNSKEYSAEISKINKKFDIAGLSGHARDQAMQSSGANVINNLWSKDPSTYNPSKTSRMVMSEVRINGETYLTPTIIKTDSSASH